MLIDVDYFKKVNDTYGHDAGDVVLKSLAQLLLNTVRQDDVVARYGGEEFAILMANTGIEEAQNIGRRIRVLAQSNPISLPSGATVGITLSIGLSAVKNEDQTFAAAMKRADIALYHAKGEGRNRLNVFLSEKTDKE
jgi:diguanylate cyclase (GGDEF)-like protein